MAFARILFKVLLGLTALLVLIGLLLPDTARIERAIQINASPERIFPHLNGMQAYHAWSPWRDTAQHQYAFSGPETGVGSRMTWRSEASEKNQGSMEIILSETNKQVQSSLDFGGKGGGITSFVLTPGETAGQTELTWRFDTDFGWDLYGRYIGLLLDQMIGNSYQQGLRDLKQLVEN